VIDHIISNDVGEILRKIDGQHFIQRRILITGGSGFLGSWLTDVLLEIDADVTCLDNLSTGLVANVNHHFGRRQFRFVQDDVISLGSDEKYDCVFHLATRASPEEYQQHPIETLLANSLGTHNVLELARKSDAPVFYASSSEIYGDAQLVPTPEEYWGNVSPVGPRSCYDEGKRFGEALFMAYSREYGLDTRIARIFNTYGPRIRATGVYGRVIPRFVKQALAGETITVYGNGSQTRSFCYVSDTILGILKLMGATKARAEPVNIGGEHETTILELARKIKDLIGTESAIAFGSLPVHDPKRRCPDISRAKGLLNWTPAVNLDHGLKKTIEWFRASTGQPEVNHPI
jgi:UDP-glucuronate decarboxylase